MPCLRWSAVLLAAALLLIAAPGANAQSASGPVAAYGFEESFGPNAVDSAAGANPGTLAGPVRATAGRFGSALSFDGINDRVDVADSASLDLTAGMTLEAWVRPETVSNWRTVVLKERPGQLTYALYASQDAPRPMAELSTSTGQRDARASGSLPASQWSHLATTYDGATLKVFVNGTEVASQAMTGLVTTTTGALRIGGNAVWGEYFHGLIDEVRIYGRALSAAELTADMGRAVVNAEPDTEAPSAPTLTATVQTGDDVQLDWTAATDDVGVKEYRVYRDGTLLTTRAATLARQYTDFNRPAGTATYTVVAVDDAGNAGQPGAADATVAADTTPPTVSLTAICNGATVLDEINVKANFADDRGPVTLTVKVDDTTIFTDTLPASGSKLVFWETRSFSNGTHFMTATARDAAGNEATTPPCEWNVHNPDYTIGLASPSDGDVVSGTVDLRAQPLADGQPRTSGFVVFSGTGLSTTTDSSSPYERTWNTNTLANGVYTLQVASYTFAYNTPDATSTIQVRVENVVAKPVGLSATAEGDDAKLAWTAPPSGSNVNGYRVLRDGAQIATLGGTATTYTDADRPAGTYRYRLVAVNAGGVASDPSDEASVTITPPATPPGLVAAYGFETASGTTAVDSSASGAHAGTISGATSVTGGRFGRALSFDGVNDIVSVPDASPLDLAPGMTLEAWVKPDSPVSDWRTVLLKERPGQLAYALYASTDNSRPMTEIAASGQREARGTAALPASTWSHLAATYDKATLRLYVNGVQVASTPSTAALFNSASALRIGGNQIWGEYFSGLIDEVRIYERALSASEIQVDSGRAVTP